MSKNSLKRAQTKQYLKQIALCDCCIKVIQTELHEQQTQQKEGAILLNDYEPAPPNPELLQDLRGQEEKRSHIIQQIESMDNPLQRDVLMQYYAMGEVLYKIAAALSYSEDRIAHVHLEALDTFFQKYLSKDETVIKDNAGD